MKKGVLFVLILFLAGALFAPLCQAEKIGIIADIHAGKELVRNRSKYTTGNIVYPRKYMKYFKRVLNEMANAGVRKVISLGDQVAKGGDGKRARKLVKTASCAGMEMIWVRGNHENKRSSAKVFFPTGTYYFEQDFGNWKIITLDSNEKNSLANGGIKEAQAQWLREKIDGTEKNIIIAMHHPIFEIRQGRPDEVASDWDEFEEMASSSGKVKYVLSGHTHPTNLFSKELHGIQYRTVPPLTIKGNLGYHLVLDLE